MNTKYRFHMSTEPGADVQRKAARAVAAELKTAIPEELAAAGYTLYFASPNYNAAHVLEGMWAAAVEMHDWKNAHVLADAIAALKGKP
jgi:hypothetical protein